MKNGILYHIRKAQTVSCVVCGRLNGIMNFLVIDGNSLVNRAFFGIKLLTAKDGHYTNAIFGFMNIFLHLMERTHAECVAVAFDLKSPTFRHQRYDEYKAGRKSMPPELFEQMEPLKELLRAYGCHIVTCEGYEADDILGTLSAHIGGEDHCFIATGDSDALQLVRHNVTVLLTTTKMGQTVTTEYTPETLYEAYGVSPAGMIEIKALQGDSSDHIPGVAGIGPKTAGELIKKYGTIDEIYANLEELDVTNNVREKLRKDKDSAYLSHWLGTICLSAPIESSIENYKLNQSDPVKLKQELAKHEMFKLISRLHLDDVKSTDSENTPSSQGIVSVFSCDEEQLVGQFKNAETAFVLYHEESENNGALLVQIGDIVYCCEKNADAVIGLLHQCVTVSDAAWITTQSKKLFRMAEKAGIRLPLPAFDIELAAYLLNPNASDYQFDSLSLSYGVQEPALQIPEDLDASDEKRRAFKNVSLMPGLYRRMYAQLAENEQNALLTEMEIPLARVLASMELEGMAIDRAAIERYSEVLSDNIKTLENEIYEAAGETFNINSPKQLGVVLFEKLHLPAKKKTKTGYSTNAEVLEGLAQAYPIVEKILSYRTYSKLKSTYCDGLLKAVDDDGRVRSTFNQTETRTGRLSSTEPNLQNIPVRTAIGREFRKFFVARDGFAIVDADYSQIELRVLAALSDDKNMIDCFNNNIDIHTVTAAKVFGLPEDQVTPELRSKAKAVNFGIVYGIGAFSLSKDIHVSRAEAEQFISAYLGLYAGVDAYMRKSIEIAKEKGYAETILHRRRYLPELTSSNHMTRAFGERVARNMPIQGTAADIIKMAMIRVYDRLQRELPEAKLIMQVHDELMIEAPVLLQEKAARLLQEEMEKAAELSVKLSVDVGVGKTWYEAKG